MSASLLKERLRSHVHILAEVIGERNTQHPTAIEAARAYIRRQLEQMGHSVHEQRFSTSHRTAANLEVVLPGRRPSAATLVVGAHYDSAPGTPGADDNASAVAILLEIARACSGLHPKRMLRIVFYDCEEPPHFNLGEMGSREHAQSLRRAGESVMGMICLESLGYFPRRPKPAFKAPWHMRAINRVLGGRNVIIVSNISSVPFGFRFLWAFARSGLFPFIPAAAPRRLMPVIELSDHRSYWDEGHRALMVTNPALLRNPNYHQCTDRLETIDLERMAALCRTLTRCVLRLAGGSGVP